MRDAWKGMVVVIALVTFGAPARGAENAPEAFVKDMKAINTAATDIRTNVTSKDFVAVGKHAVTLQTLLKSTNGFWEKRKVPTAVEHNGTAAKAASDLAAAAKAKDEDGVLRAQRALTGACTACHNAHRERLPDGKYAIK